MVRRALLIGVALLPLSLILGGLLGRDVAFSAGLGVVVVVANFVAHGLSLAWAAGISVTAVHAVAVGGFVVRMGVIVGLLFALTRTAFFSPLAFGISVVVSTVALLTLEAKLVMSGVGAQLEIPPDPVAVRARDALRSREEAG